MNIPERRRNAIANLEQLIQKKGYTILPMMIIENIPTYYVIDEEENEIGYIKLTCLKDHDYEIATYTTNNRWFGNSTYDRHRAIHITYLLSNVKGMGKLILSYGVLKIWEQNPEVSYGILDDDSENSTYKENNIYTALSFTPVYKATNQGGNKVKFGGSEGGSEKQCLLSEFLDKAEGIIGDRITGSKRPFSNGNGSKRANVNNGKGSKRANGSKRVNGSKRAMSTRSMSTRSNS